MFFFWVLHIGSFHNIWNWNHVFQIYFTLPKSGTNDKFFFKVLQINCKLSTKHSKDIFRANVVFPFIYLLNANILPIHCTTHTAHLSTLIYPIYLYTESQEMHIHISMQSIIFLIFFILFFLNIKSIGKLLHKSIIYHNFFSFSLS